MTGVGVSAADFRGRAGYAGDEGLGPPEVAPFEGLEGLVDGHEISFGPLEVIEFHRCDCIGSVSPAGPGVSVSPAGASRWAVAVSRRGEPSR